jgi:hypothetical protein
MAVLVHDDRGYITPRKLRRKKKGLGLADAIVGGIVSTVGSLATGGLQFWSQSEQMDHMEDMEKIRARNAEKLALLRLQTEAQLVQAQAGASTAAFSGKAKAATPLILIAAGVAVLGLILFARK